MLRAMRASRLAFVILIAACGDDGSTPGPFDSLTLDGDFKNAGLTAPVHVARDKYGVAHISGDTTADVAYVQGYVMAHDRLPQMDILRRYGAGTLSELFGALDPSVIDTDLQMRVHRMKPLAEQTWQMLQASSEPTDKELVELLQRFADGVNAYATDLQAGKWTVDPQILVSFDPERFTAWTPVDSLVLGRFQAFALSYSADFELDLTDLYQRLRASYEGSASDPASVARRGISRDLMTIAPVGTKPTIDGFPNVDTDTGSRSDAGRAGKHRKRTAPAAAAPVSRPIVPNNLIADARKFMSTDVHNGPLGALGPRAFGRPWAGSNNWAVSPTLAGGKALLATDQHLQLPNPSIFYPTHLIVKDKLDALGITFPGIPGVILGSNGNVAWAATVSEHDVNDIYLETIAPCGAASCVKFNGQDVPIQSFDEEIKIGALGTITETRMAHYELVPHHGPIIPKIANHQIVPRTGTQAMTIKYTGYEPTFEIRALWNLAHAKTVDDGFKALSDFGYGSQNWTMIDNQGNIGWTTNAVVPLRAPAAYTWDPATQPDGLAPFFVLPGDGTAEWQGRMSSRYVPHSINPAQGYLATANADPVGATFDNNALNQPVVDGRPLYAGVTYAAGVREERITNLITDAAARGPVTLDDMERIQHDNLSTIGEKLLPPIQTALGYLTQPTGAPTDVAPYLAGLATADRQRLDKAAGLMLGWSLATPPATTGTPGSAELTDSAATSLFNTWMHFFLIRAFNDEFAHAGFSMFSLDSNFIVRIAYRALVHPETLVQSASSGQPILCDDFATTGPDDSCSKMVLVAMVDAVTFLESPQGFGTAAVDQWQWGKKHTLTITPLFPNHALDLGPFPKAGDNFNINRADQGWADTDFSQFADGPAQRFLAEAAAGETIKVKWALPGGVIYDSRSPHYRDLLDMYYLPQKHFDAPFSVAEIVANGENRWEFHR
jgi:penicillin amidase